MKRTLVLTVGLFAASALVSAGLTAQMVVGVGGGISSSTFYGADADEPGKGSRTGLRVGGFVAIPVANRLSVVPAATWVQKGVSYEDSGDELKLKSSYIEVPVLLAVSLTGTESSVGIGVHAGPSVAFEVGCDVEATSGGITASGSCDDGGFSDRQSVDFGALVGATVSVPVGDALSLMFSGGVDFGLRTLDSSDDPDKIKNRSIYGSVFAAFPVGG